MSVDRDASKGKSEADFRALRLDSEISTLRRPGMTNGELAELISADLRSLFWRRELDVFFARELGE